MCRDEVRIDVSYKLRMIVREQPLLGRISEAQTDDYASDASVMAGAISPFEGRPRERNANILGEQNGPEKRDLFTLTY